MLHAAAHLLETGGTRALTMENIASAAKVSKATLYRWWKSPSAIALEGFMEIVRPDLEWMPEGSVREVLLHQGMVMMRVFTTMVHGRTVRKILADAQTDSEVAQAFREQFIVPRRVGARVLFTDAIARGEIRPDVDIDTLIDMFVAPIYFRLLTRYAPLDEEFVTRIVDFTLLGAQPRCPKAANND